MAKQSFQIDPEADEPPLLTEIRSYWERQRGPRAMPSRQDIKPADIKPHLPYVLLADVLEGGADFRYRLVGSRLQSYFSGNPTGHTMRNALAQFGDNTVAQTIGSYRSAVERRAPVRIRGTGNYFAQKAKQFDALLTPLSDDGRTVNMIFGTFLFEWDKNVMTHAHAATRSDEAALEKALHG